MLKKFFILAAISFLYYLSLCFLNALFLYEVLIVALKRMVCNGTKGVALDGRFMMDHFSPPNPVVSEGKLMNASSIKT